MDQSVTKTLDARGLTCPMPSVKTSLEMENLNVGDVLEVLADDPISKRDLPRWAEATGHKLLHMVEIDKTIVGMVVDSASEAIRFTKDNLEKTPALVDSQIHPSFIRGVAKLSDTRLLIILDLHRVLTSKEFNDLQAVSSAV